VCRRIQQKTNRSIIELEFACGCINFTHILQTFPLVPDLHIRSFRILTFPTTEPIFDLLSKIGVSDDSLLVEIGLELWCNVIGEDS
jgi:hypothetical protein